MKRYKISLFDLLLLLLVVLAGGAAYWQLHHTTVEQPTTAETVLDDMYRSAERYTDQEAMEETADYVVDYRLKIENVDEDHLRQLLKEDTSVYNVYGQGLLGTLKSVTYSEQDGTTYAELTISLYSRFYRTYVVGLASNTKVFVGGELSLQLEDGSYIGTGTVTWMQH